MGIKGYAKDHNMRIVAAHHLIVRTGLRYLMTKEEKAQRDYTVTVLPLLVSSDKYPALWLHSLFQDRDEDQKRTILNAYSLEYFSCFLVYPSLAN